jgi:flagellar hook protein FlgE
VQYDYYFTKTGETTDASGAITGTTWEVAVYRNADASTGSTTSFPYSSSAVSVASLSFDANGQLTSATNTDIVDPVTAKTITMDYSGFSQLSSDFAATGSADGQAASTVSSVGIGTDGVVTVSYSNGTTKPLYQIPLATVASPDNLTLLSGNVYSANGASGVTVTGFPQSTGLGSIQSGALESSNVDLAGELSDIMDVLVNLKR